MRHDCKLNIRTEYTFHKTRHPKLYKLITLSQRHPKSALYFRSINDRLSEIKKQVISREALTIHPFSLLR